MPGISLDNQDMVGKRMDEAQKACDFVRVQKKDQHVHGTRIRFKRRLCK